MMYNLQSQILKRGGLKKKMSAWVNCYVSCQKQILKIEYAFEFSNTSHKF